MKKAITAIYIIIGLTFILCIEQCKKDTAHLNISLHDQPLSVIKAYTQGSWQLRNEKGGFCGNCIFYPTDSTFNLYMNLDSERIVLRNKYFQTLDTTIVWSYINVFGDSAYALNFNDAAGIPYTFVADGIYNDTLVLYQPGPDGISFYYTK